MSSFFQNDSATYYTVECVIRDYVNFDSYRIQHSFYSMITACVMARKFANCDDVVSIDVVDQMTGEVIFSYDEASGVTIDQG